MKKVLKLWKVILFVILGVIGIGGVTVLSLYLMGRFDDVVIEPEDMSFSYVLPEGNGSYNEQLARFEVAPNEEGSFRMVINSTTEGVTETNVTLSLLGQLSAQDTQGYITDGVIRVPQQVQLNRPFTVYIENEDYFDLNNQEFSWTNGGTSVLTARSSNVLLASQTVTIAIDVPVYDLALQVADTEQTGDVQEVVVNTSFSLDTIFSPEQSKFMFSDTSREKQVFFSINSERISYDIATNRFTANETTGNEADPITAYTFANAYYQEQILAMFESYYDENNLENYVAMILQYFEGHPETCVSKTVEIRVLDVDVDSVEIFGSNLEELSVNAYFDQYFMLTASSNNGNASLGASIKDSVGTSLNSLFGNIGLKLPSGATTQGLEVLGGRIMRVEALPDGTYSITRETYSSETDYFNPADGVVYYLLPSTTPTSYGDYYWRMNVSSETNADVDYQFEINFFFENESGYWENYFAFDGETSDKQTEKTFILNVINHEEEGLGWREQNSIRLSINYTEDGEPIPGNVNLSDLINPLSSSNIYQSVRYFLLKDEDDQFELTENFNCKAGVNYSVDYQGNPLSIAGIGANADGSYTLYEVDSLNTLTALASFEGTAKIVVASIKTYADRTPYKTDDGKYLIVKTSRVKDVLVDSTLSIANMDVSFSFAEGILPNEQNQYYIPAVNKDNAHNDLTMLTFNMTLENAEAGDDEKVISAFTTTSTEQKLEIVCLDALGRETNGYVTLQGIQFLGEELGNMNFQGVLGISSNYFSADIPASVEGIYVKLQLKYNDGIDTYTKDINNRENDGVDHFYIYYQTPVAMTGAYEDLNMDPTQTIQATIRTDGIEIFWGETELQATADQTVLDVLNSYLSFTLIDQRGNEIDPNAGIYDVKFEETPVIEGQSKVLSLNADQNAIQNFVSTGGQSRETTLMVYVVDAQGEYVYITNEGGESVPLCSPVFNFDVTSEGLDRVEADYSEWDTTDITTKEWGEADDPSNITIQRYVVPGNEIILADLLNIYLSSDPENPTNDMVFRIDNTYLSGLSSSMQTQIMNMVKFNDEMDANTSIADYRGEEISKIDIVLPFKDETGTDLVFSVTDNAGILYDITLTLRFLPDLQIASNFNAYFEDYSDYLVQNNPAIGVYGNMDYNIGDYITLSSHSGRGTYSWASIMAGSDVSGYIQTNETGLGSLVRETNGGTDTIYLRLNDVKEYRTFTFTIYYGTITTLTQSIQISLYINPNYVIRQSTNAVIDGTTTPYLDLSSVAAGRENVSSVYQLYKMTDYLQTGTFENEIQGINLSYENISDNRYILITNTGTIGFAQNSTLEVELGEYELQTFSLRVSENIGGSQVVLDALRIVVDEGGSELEVVLPDENGTEISYGIGFQNFDIASVITTENNSEILSANFNGQNVLILLPGTNYRVADGYSILEVAGSGDLIRNSATMLTTRTQLMGGYFSTENNWFEISQVLTDNTGDANQLTIIVTINAIISKLGDKFVYYNNSAETEIVPTDMIYNSFGDLPLEDLLGLDDYTSLEENDVYQVLDAGQSYTIVHNSDNQIGVDEEGNAQVRDLFGLYFSKTLSNAYAGLQDTEVNVSIVEDAQGYVDGLAELSTNGENFETVLKINHLESQYTDAYIVLRFEVYKSAQPDENFVYYYRIKVTPSFSLGSIKYPYADDAEYLDGSNLQADGSFVIDFEEELTPTNSKWANGKRFAEPEISLDENETLKFRYSVTNQNLPSGVEYSFSQEGVLIVKLNGQTSAVTLNVEKCYYLEDAEGNITELVGSAREYQIKFYQSNNYTHDLYLNSQELTDTDDVYSVSLTAGQTDESVLTAEINIRSGENGGNLSRITDFYTYIEGSEEDLADALQRAYFIKAGTEVQTTSDGEPTTITLADDLFLGWFEDETAFESFLEGQAGAEENVYTFDIGGVTYSVTITTENNPIDFTYAFLDVVRDSLNRITGKNLRLMPQQNITKDNSFEIGFYTDQKVVFRVNLQVESYFDISLNNNFAGGQTYSLLNAQNSVFANLSAENRTITDVSIALANGDESYMADVTLADLLKITTGATWQETTIEFAHLSQTATFEFVGTISVEGVDSTYTFEFAIETSADVNLQTNRIYSDTNDRYGKLEFGATVQDVVSYFAEFDVAAETSATYLFADDTIQSTVSLSEDKTSVIFNENSVGSVATLTRQLYVDYAFNNGTSSKTIFTFAVGYRFALQPSVSLSTNYPKPDGVTTMETEYISTTQNSTAFTSATYENFFNSSADFASENRVVVSHVHLDYVADFMTSIGETWSISVSEINNARVSISGATTKEITTSTEDRSIISGLEVTSTDDRPNINLVFSLADSSYNGSVSFAVTVNAYTTTYTVEILAGNVYSVQTYAPNYANNQETIYAEDLSSQEQTIFAQNRILNYAFASSVTQNSTFYARFQNSANEVQVVTITATNPGQTINQDLGRALSGYEYLGTFTTSSGVDEMGQSTEVNYQTVFSINPTLTSRITVSYQNVPIAFTDDIQLMLATPAVDEGGTIIRDENNNIQYENPQLASNVILSASDYDVLKQYVVLVKFGDNEYLNLNSLYNVMLNIEFDVTGNADEANGYTTVDINTNPNAPQSLLGFTSLGITNTRQNALYTRDMIANSAGEIALTIYGFNDLQVADTVTSEGDITATDEATRLQQVAGYIHNTLINTESENGTTYWTGLTPSPKLLSENGGQGINHGSNGAFDNYLYNVAYTQGNVPNGKVLDYNLWAMGANNDGNHVMMRLSYTVSFGDQTLTVYHNILFRVVSENNTSFRFKNRQEDTASYSSGASEVIGNQSVMSNYQSPYEISNAGTSGYFNLWNLGESAGQAASTIIANMYGSTANSANEFSYTYTPNITSTTSTKYNDYELALGENYWTEGSDGVYENTSQSTQLRVDYRNLDLGSKYYVIELENEFNYKARFYFTLTSPLNPQIETSSLPALEEGGTIAIGSLYREVTANKELVDGANYVVYETFNYTTNQVGSPLDEIQITLPTITTTNEDGETTSPTISDVSVTFSFAYNYPDLGLTTFYLNSTISPTTSGDNSAVLTFNLFGGSKTFYYYNEDGEIIDKINDEDITFTAANVAAQNSPITLRINYGTSETKGLYKVEYLNAVRDTSGTTSNLALTQSYSVASTYTRPDFTPTSSSASSPDYTIELNGIDAYAFSNDEAGIDEGAVTKANANLYSNVTSLKVERIDFFYNGRNIGTSYSAGAPLNSADAFARNVFENNDLVTNSDVSYVYLDVENPTIISGSGYDANKAFTVPYIDGTLFGQSDILNDVEMQITLCTITQTDGNYQIANEAVLSKMVSIQRELDTDGLFETNIADRSSPVAEPLTGDTVYNDTLEVKLAPQESVTLAISNDISHLATNETIVLTNPNDYSVTEYVGISENITNLTTNLGEGGNFYVRVTAHTINGENVEENPTLVYNGSSNSLQYEEDDGSAYSNYFSGHIAEYNTITLNIEHVNELSTSNAKPVRLFFLYHSNISNTNYQVPYDFNVYPLYRGTTGDTAFVVDDYLKVTDETQTYYIITLEQWASGITLIENISSASPAPTFLSAGAEKFYFNISSEGGNAFIDENGTITTSTNFNITSEAFIVDVYMKVSGFDGYFEGNNTRLSLGQFRMSLNSNTTFETTPIISTSGVYEVYNESESGAQTTHSQNVITLPTGFSVYGTSGTTATQINVETPKEDDDVTDITFPTYSYEVGSTVDFGELLDEFSYGNDINVVDLGLTNVTYHIVDDSGTPIYYRNLNSWTFTTAGMHEVKVIIHGLSRGFQVGSISHDYYQVTLNILIYDTNINESNSVGVENGSYTLPSGEGTWYLINDDGTLENVSDFSSGTAGIFERQYLVVNGDQIKTVTNTYFVYNETIAKEIGLRPLDSFNLNNLMTSGNSESYVFYDSSFNQVDSSSISYSDGVGTQREATFYCATLTDGEVTNLQQISLTVNLIPSDTNQSAILIEELAENDNAKRLEAVRAEISEILNSSRFELYLRDNGGVLTAITNETSDIEITNETEFLTVQTAENGLKTFTRFRFTFYKYADELTLTYKTNSTNSFALSNLKQSVLNAVGKIEDVQVGFYQLNGTSLAQVEYVSIDVSYRRTYYVLVGDTYYLIDVVLFTDDNFIAAQGTSLSEFDAYVRAELDIAADETISYVDDTTMTALESAPTGVFGCFAVVDGEYYHFDVLLYSGESFYAEQLAVAYSAESTDESFELDNFNQEILEVLTETDENATISYYLPSETTSGQISYTKFNQVTVISLNSSVSTLNYAVLVGDQLYDVTINVDFNAAG